MFEKRAVWETLILVDVYGLYSDEEGEEIYRLSEKYATVIATNEHKFNPHGLTKIAILSESHIAIHTYPEAGAVTVTFSTCSEEGKEVAKQFITNLKQRGYTYSYKILQRGRHGIKCIASGDSHHEKEARALE